MQHCAKFKVLRVYSPRVHLILINLPGKYVIVMLFTFLDIPFLFISISGFLLILAYLAVNNAQSAKSKNCRLRFKF